MRKLKLNTKSFLFKYISVLFVVLMVPTVFGYIVSEVSLNSALDQIKSKNYEALTYIQRSIDSDLSDIQQTAVDIASGDELGAFAEGVGGNYTALDIAGNKFFPPSAVLKDYVQDTFIYMPRKNLIITSNNTIYTVEQYCSKVLRVDDKGRNEFTAIINATAFNSIYPAKSMKIYDHALYKNYLFHVQSFPFMGDFKGNVVTILNVDKMISHFAERFESGESSLYLVDNNGQIIFSIGHQGYVTDDFSDAYNGYGDDRIDGDKVTYCVRKSTQSRFNYVYVENDRSLQSAITPARMALYLYILFVLLFGTAGIFWIAQKNTKPVREITGMLGTQYHGDEFEQIQNAIRNILSEKARMEPILEESETTLRKNLISDILRGNFMSAEQIEEACKKVDISFLHEYFCVMYFSLDEIPQEDIPIIKYAVSNIAEEVFNPIGEVFTDDSELYSMVGIINLSNCDEETEKQILAQLSFIRVFFVENFDITINIGVGGIMKGAEQISTSYSNAKEAAEYCALTGAKAILPYADIKTADYRYSYPLEIEDKLNSAVINGDMALVRQLIDQVVSANASLSLDMSRCLFFDLTATALKIMSNKAINLSAVFGSNDSPFEKLMECKSIAELVATIHNIFEKICTQITENHSARKEKLKIAITDYVKDNYNNPNMSLGMVADEFSMNYTYMSHFFKDFIGENFIDYISDLRVKKAAELLRTTDMPINDIATEVGYANATVLIKIFKKITKTTPGTYRKNAKIK